MDARVMFVEGFSGIPSSRPATDESLEDLLAEPIIQMLMARDGVHPDEVRRLAAMPRRAPPRPVKTRPTPAEPVLPAPAESTVECLDLMIVTETRQLLEKAAAMQRKPVREFVLDSAKAAARMLVRQRQMNVEPCAFREPIGYPSAV